MREQASERCEARARGEAALGFAPTAIVVRLVLGAAFGAAWMSCVVHPLVRAVESDVSSWVMNALAFLGVLAPVGLFLRRHALDVKVRWSATGITLLRGERVATSIAWADATVLSTVARRAGLQTSQIVDAGGRQITLLAGDGLALPRAAGRHRISRLAADDIFRAARAGGATFVTAEPAAESAGQVPLMLVVLAVLAIGFVDGPRVVVYRAHALALAFVCLLLLAHPIRRAVRALAQRRGREMLLLDTEERGRIRARRLDGSRVLLDVSAASHPDAMLSARRGFVNAVLEVPIVGAGASYRAQETPIPARFVETRDDRVLRFESLRAALVDVIGYGAFFATSVAALVAGA